MEKLYVLMRRAETLADDAFQDGLWKYVKASAGPDCRPVRRVVSVPDRTADQCAQPAVDGYPAFHAIEECWFQAGADLERYCAGLARPEWATAFWLYHVAEFVRKDAGRRAPPFERLPGVKQIYLTRRAPGQSHAAFVHHWREVHGPLALRVHVGMCKYVQNVVLRKLSSQAPDIDGIPELHFASLEDAVNLRYSSPEGRQAIAEDRPNFVTRSDALFCGEYLVSG